MNPRIEKMAQAIIVEQVRNLTSPEPLGRTIQAGSPVNVASAALQALTNDDLKAELEARGDDGLVLRAEYESQVQDLEFRLSNLGNNYDLMEAGRNYDRNQLALMREVVEAAKEVASRISNDGWSVRRKGHDGSGSPQTELWNLRQALAKLEANEKGQ